MKKFLASVLIYFQSKKLTNFFYVILYKIPRRIKTSWSILTGSSSTWILIEVPTLLDLGKILGEYEDFNLHMKYEGLQPYVVDLILKKIADGIEEDDMILQKAKFQAYSDHFNKTGELLSNS